VGHWLGRFGAGAGGGLEGRRRRVDRVGKERIEGRQRDVYVVACCAKKKKPK
jgi:hypothetical protein